MEGRRAARSSGRKGQPSHNKRSAWGRQNQERKACDRQKKSSNQFNVCSQNFPSSDRVCFLADRLAFVCTRPRTNILKWKNANYELSNCEVTVYIKTAFPSPNCHNSQVTTPVSTPDHLHGHLSRSVSCRETNSRSTPWRPITRPHLPLEDQGRVTPTCAPIFGPFVSCVTKHS